MTGKPLRLAACLACGAVTLTALTACGRDLGDLTEPAPQSETDRETIIVTMDAEQYSLLMQYYPELATSAAGGTDQTTPQNTAPVSQNQPESSATVPAATNGGSQNGTASTATPLTYSKEELVTYFNNCANKIKTNMPAFTKEEQTKVTDIQLSNSLANSLVSVVKDALLSEDLISTPVTKGANCNAIVSPEGQSYVSTITAADISNITVQQAGSGYTMTVTMPQATNPDDSSAYGRIFQFVSVDDVLNEYAPEVGATVARENITINYSGCTATLTVDANGNPTNYQTYVTCVITLKDASIKKGITINSDVDITLATTTQLKDFTW